jgi:hypothetical protein
MAERGEFELPVPICDQSDDGIGLLFRRKSVTNRAGAGGFEPAVTRELQACQKMPKAGAFSGVTNCQSIQRRRLSPFRSADL